MLKKLLISMFALVCLVSFSAVGLSAQGTVKAKSQTNTVETNKKPTVKKTIKKKVKKGKATEVKKEETKGSAATEKK